MNVYLTIEDANGKEHIRTLFYEIKNPMKVEISATEEQIKDYRLKLGDKIRIVREKRGYSQKQLAEKMSINRSTISKIENGKFGITVDYLVRFSIFLEYEFKVVEK